jgi:glycosyltransferase involved in cell wall biosynthesis
LPEYDIFAIRSDYFELSKSMLEALLTGLPTIISRRPGDPVPELSDDICLLVDNSAHSYRRALQQLIANDLLRARLGRTALLHARTRWSPEKCEGEFVNIYQNLLAARREVAALRSVD